ncbi:hypothetical protein LCGC14_2934700, partial [marine sediment metagenome]
MVVREWDGCVNRWAGLLCRLKPKPVVLR